MIQKGTFLQLEYHLFNTKGEPLESSEEDGPMELNVGDGDRPDAIEEALVGRKAGDVFEITLQPEDAFGEFNAEGIVTVPRVEFPEDAELEQGLFVELEVTDEEGQPEVLETRVVEVNAEAVVLDANHPLAGEIVTFRLRIVSVGEPEESSE